MRNPPVLPGTVRRRRGLTVAAAGIWVYFAVTVGAAVEPAARTWVVDASAAAGGSGAAETPFTRLGEAERSSAPGDQIVVIAGDFDAGIALKPGQHLLGRREAGGVHPASARRPRVGAASAPGIVLADGCTVRGLSVVGDPPILGALAGDIVIDDLRTTGGGEGGIVLDRVRGAVSISRVEAVDSSGHGLSVTEDRQAAVALNVRESTFTGHRSAGIDIRIGNGGRILLEGNTIDGNALGMVVVHTGGDGELHAEILDNAINGRAGGSHTAVQLMLAGQSRHSSVLSAVLRGNTVGSEEVPDSGSQQGQGVEIYASGEGRLTAEMTENTIRAIGNGSAVRLVSSAHTGILDVLLRGNDASVHPSLGFPLAGLEVLVGTNPGDSPLVRLDFTNNIAFAGGVDLAGVTLTTMAGSPRVELSGYRGRAGDQAAFEAFLDTTATTVAPSSRGFSNINAGVVAGRMRSSDHP